MRHIITWILMAIAGAIALVITTAVGAYLANMFSTWQIAKAMGMTEQFEEAEKPFDRRVVGDLSFEFFESDEGFRVDVKSGEETIETKSFTGKMAKPHAYAWFKTQTA